MDTTPPLGIEHLFVRLGRIPGINVGMAIAWARMFSEKNGYSFRDALTEAAETLESGRLLPII